jgi:hypothetical protein
MSIIKTHDLPTHSFGTLKEAKSYVGGFKMVDEVVKYDNLKMNEGRIQIKKDGDPKVLDLQMTDIALNSLLSDVTPGAAKFLKREDVPADLVHDIINRMMHERRGKGKLLRIETNPKGNQYLKAVLSTNYRPYNNSEFIDYVIGNTKGKDIEFLRPVVSSGLFSVSVFNRQSNIQAPISGRDIKLGANYANGECGNRAVQINAFTYDGYCTNGCIFGQNFLAEACGRIFHFGDITKFQERLDKLQMNAANAEKVIAERLANMYNAAMTVLYYKHIAEKACSVEAIMKRKVFEEKLPYVEGENQYDFFNRVTEYAHKGEAANEIDASGRLRMERIGGYIVENALS